MCGVRMLRLGLHWRSSGDRVLAGFLLILFLPVSSLPLQQHLAVKKNNKNVLGRELYPWKMTGPWGQAGCSFLRVAITICLSWASVKTNKQTNLANQPKTTIYWIFFLKWTILYKMYNQFEIHLNHSCIEMRSSIIIWCPLTSNHSGETVHFFSSKQVQTNG